MYHNNSKKQIILVRHAKALELNEFRGMDFDRPLSEKGVNSLNIIARYLRLIGVKPDKIVASPSVRTKQTAEGLRQQFFWVNVEYINDLYNGGSAGKRDSDSIHLSLIQKAKKEVTIFMIVGHNDDLTNFARYLTGDGVPSLKKGSVAVLSVPDNFDWKDIKKDSLSFVYYLTPQFLRLEEFS
jgi:phosphohistidine phosphatase